MQQHQELAVREFEEYCKSDELSIATLREKTRRIPPFALSESDAFIFACENGRVTRAVVEHFLRVYPDLVGQRRCVETGRVVAYISSSPGEDTPFPLQALCHNKHCKSNRAIARVIEAYPDAARCVIRTLSGSERVGLTALHLYIWARRDGGDLRLVQRLVGLYPAALTKLGEEVGPYNDNIEFTPLGFYLSNWREISHDFVEALIDKDGKCVSITGGRPYFLPVVALLHNPHISSISMKVIATLAKKTVLNPSEFVLHGRINLDNMIHHACASEFVTVEILNLLLSIDENLTTTLIGTANHQNKYPLHVLCRNSKTRR